MALDGFSPRKAPITAFGRMRAEMAAGRQFVPERPSFASNASVDCPAPHGQLMRLDVFAATIHCPSAAADELAKSLKLKILPLQGEAYVYSTYAFKALERRFSVES